MVSASTVATYPKYSDFLDGGHFEVRLTTLLFDHKKLSGQDYSALQNAVRLAFGYWTINVTR